MTFLFAAPAFAADALFEMSFSADKNEITIGDELTLRIEILHGRDFKLLPLPKDTSFGPFQMKRIEPIPPKGEGSSVREGYRVVVTVFEVGEFKVPPFAVKFADPQGKQGQVFTDEVKITVKSVGRTDKDKDDIRPIKAPYRLGAFLAALKPWFWMILAGVLALGAAVFFVLRRQKRDPEANLPPYERAILHLSRLEKKQYLETGQVKQYFTDLGSILERYIIEELKTGAYELTTEEFMEKLRGSSVDPAVQDSIRKVFQISDLAKFAKWTPPKEESVEALQTARAVIERTHHAPEEKKS